MKMCMCLIRSKNNHIEICQQDIKKIDLFLCYLLMLVKSNKFSVGIYDHFEKAMNR
jgi:hypothetical protein